MAEGFLPTAIPSTWFEESLRWWNPPFSSPTGLSHRGFRFSLPLPLSLFSISNCSRRQRCTREVTKRRNAHRRMLPSKFQAGVDCLLGHHLLLPSRSLMNPRLFFLLALLSVAWTPCRSQPPSPGSDTVSFKPSIAVIVGVLSIMFSLTFLLLIYAKFCQIPGRAAGFYAVNEDQVLPRTRTGRESGVDRRIVESLPFFLFSALRGSKEGLECSVCLSRFDDKEVLRLLPKCKHAFHITCIDRWLESHSSCPLCRRQVESADLLLAHSSRISRNPSNLTDDAGIELFVRREEAEAEGSSSLSSFRLGSFRQVREKVKEEPLLEPESAADPRFLHRFKHRIIISDVVYKHRWSDVNSADLMLLNSEMLRDGTSKRFSATAAESVSDQIGSGEPLPESGDKIRKIKVEMEKKRLLEMKASKLKPDNSALPSSLSSPSSPSSPAIAGDAARVVPGKRSMSEIVNVARFLDLGAKIRTKEMNPDDGVGNEDSVRKVWLPIARRTVLWFTGRERRSQPGNSLV
ncbi:E3 ubiquitin-protein ligase ATL42-like [Nymphaea colorata]|nr:E3 ubiquitin-protein ligase ATL42-like [Nymphaea colorata]